MEGEWTVEEIIAALDAWSAASVKAPHCRNCGETLTGFQRVWCSKAQCQFVKVMEERGRSRQRTRAAREAARNARGRNGQKGKMRLFGKSKMKASPSRAA